MQMKEFSLCPRVKKAKRYSGEFTCHKWNIFMIGDGDLFSRSLKIFLKDTEIEKVSRDKANVILSVSYALASSNEYCCIRILKDRIEIQCRDNLGARNAAAILSQIIVKNEEGDYVLPCGIIEDWPDAQYRSMMFDNSCRVLIPMKKMYSYIREMALCRMNNMLFHFMSEKGSIIQMDSVPELAGCGEENFRFTKDEIRGMISYAADLGITVTPYIQVICHVHDLPLKTGIHCPGDTGEGLFNVCIGQEKTYEVIEKILAETAELFPDDVIHIGADEYDMRVVSQRKPYWDKCPHCQKLAEEKGFKTLTDYYLYAVERVNRIVNSLGKISMMWNASMQPGQLPETLDHNILMHYYRVDYDFGKDKFFNLYEDSYIDDGFGVLNSYYPHTYLDHSYYMSAEKLNGWSYLLEPRVRKENTSRIIGACCCAWGVHSHYCRTIPAGILLFADRLWNANGDPVPYDDAYGRLMTRILFDRKLPEDMNVFACIGGVLPPLEYDQSKIPAHKEYVFVSMEELYRVRDALLALDSEEDDLPKHFADAIDAVIQAKIEDLNSDTEFDADKVIRG